MGSLTEWQSDISSLVARVDERTKIMMEKINKMEKCTSRTLRNLETSSHSPDNCPTTLNLNHHLEDHTKRDKRNLFYIGIVVTAIITVAEVVSNFIIT